MDRQTLRPGPPSTAVEPGAVPPLPRVFRRLVLWTVLCTVSAAPSFIVAHDEFDEGAMILGIALFVLAYTLSTSTEAFEKFHGRPFVRRTLYIGYGLRLLLSVLYPIGMMADLLPGIVSVSVVQSAGLTPRSFEGTLATTIVQGAILNGILTLFMLVVYAVQWSTMRTPPEVRPPGFDVILPGRPIQPRLSTKPTAVTRP